MCAYSLPPVRVFPLPQEGDLKHLVEGVWGGQSALSAERDLFELAVVRWERSVEWSPWNCVVLTHLEADYHQQLDHVEEVSPLGGRGGTGWEGQHWMGGAALDGRGGTGWEGRHWMGRAALEVSTRGV